MSDWSSRNGYKARNDLVAYQAPDGSFVVREKPYRPRPPRVVNRIIIQGLPEGSYGVHDSRLELVRALVEFAREQNRNRRRR